MIISRKNLQKLLDEAYEKGKQANTISVPFQNIENIKLIPGCGTIDDIGINTYTSTYVPEACKNCPKHPTNGGDGICHCTLGGLQIKY